MKNVRQKNLGDTHVILTTWTSPYRRPTHDIIIYTAVPHLPSIKGYTFKDKPCEDNFYLKLKLIVKALGRGVLYKMEGR